MHATAAGGLRSSDRAEEHPTAEDLYRAVRSSMPRISLATVYKALEALVETGVAAKLPPVDGDSGTATTPAATPITTSDACARVPSTTCRPASTPTWSRGSIPSWPSTSAARASR